MVLALGTRTALMAATGGLRTNMKPIFGYIWWFQQQTTMVLSARL